MRVYLGADHQGFYLKNKIRDYLTKAGYQITDYSSKEFNPDDDFPQYAQAAAKRVVDEADDTDMAANRIKGVRAIVASTVEDARYGRNDNDANVLCLPARILDKSWNEPVWKDIVDTFLTTPFAGAERYIRRNRELDELS